MTNWKLGQYVRVWANEGYEYGHIEIIDSPEADECQCELRMRSQQVMLIGDDGREIYTRVKDLEEGK